MNLRTGIQDGMIDAAFVTAGTPTGAVEGMAATEDIVIVPIEKEKIDALIEKYPFYVGCAIGHFFTTTLDLRSQCDTADAEIIVNLIANNWNRGGKH